MLVTLNSVASQGVDTQLKILQTLLSILTFNSDVHDEVLGTVRLASCSTFSRQSPHAYY